MRRLFIAFVILAAMSSASVRAIENANNTTTPYNETAPTNSNIAKWNTGWTQPSTEPTGYTYATGWNYVGSVNQCSGVYLGYGWVITAAHVGAGTFNLNGVSYPVVPNTAQNIGNIDLTLFRVSPSPALPPLILRSSDPVAYSSQVVMIGFGDGGSRTNETWGYNTVTQINQFPTTPSGYTYQSNDFLTLTSNTAHPTPTNNYQVVVGDSGGGDFIYNSSTKNWELAGINEVSGVATYGDGSTQNFSGFVQIDTYATQIEQVITPLPTDTPTVPPWALIVLGGLLFLAATPRFIPRKASLRSHA